MERPAQIPVTQALGAYNVGRTQRAEVIIARGGPA